MNSAALHLLGIARKAGRVEVGEEPAGSAARAGQAKLLLVAADAADNSVRRAAHFAEGGKIPWMHTPFSKAELGRAVGRTSCAMLALTDAGLAAAIAGKLAAGDPERYGETAAALDGKAAKVLQRQKERRAHEKKLQKAKGRPWAPPDRDAPRPPRGAKGNHGETGAGPKGARPPKPRSAPPKPGARREAAAQPVTPKPKRPLPRGVITVKRKKAP